jgi:SAM-dependent methyltransferase
MTLRETERSRSFGSIARDYDRLRPATPKAAVDWLVGTGIQRAVELGAGTGRFTRILSERIPEIVATEPDPRMREVLSATLPSIPALAGTAEEIPVEDAGVDAVFCANAWHWFDPERAFTEIARVLRPGGRLAVFWNTSDGTVEWMRELFTVTMDAHAESRAPGRFALPDNAELAARFTPPERHDVPFTQPLPVEDVVALLGTYSPVLAMPESDRAAFFDRTRTFLRTHPNLAGRDVIDLPFRTVCWLTRRVPTATP